MNNEKVHLTEKGFGSEGKGAASIVASENGTSLSLRLAILPDKGIGGVCTLIPVGSWDKRQVKSFMPETAWSVSLKRNKNLGNIILKHYTGTELDRQYETAFVYNDEFKFVSSEGMSGSEEAKSLLNGILWEAAKAALLRSYDPKPDRIYFGSVALDATAMQMTYHRDKKVLA